AVFMYWVVSNFFTLLQFWVMQQPAVRSWLGIPALDKEAVAEVPASTTMAVVSPVPLSTSFTMLREARKRAATATVAAGPAGAAGRLPSA
ncbi:hypothetical protein HK405_013396, partial [Cladochytrium tenue]